MTIHFNGPLPEGTTVRHSRGGTHIRFGMGGVRLNIMGGDIHITGMGGGRRGSGGRNRGQGASSSLSRCFLDGLIPCQTNRQRRQRRHETERAPHRTVNELEHPSQPSPSARTAKPTPTPKNTKNPAEKANTSNPPMDAAKPSLSVKNTEGSRAAKNTWGDLTGTADYEASPRTGKATEIGSFAKTVETSQHAQNTNTVSPK